MTGQTGRLRRTDRLRNRRDFQRVARCGRRAASSNFVFLLASTPDGGSRGRLGVTVSRKVGNAVQRNYLKRRIREWFRGVRNEFEPAGDLVIIARQGAADLRSDRIRACLDANIRRLRESAR